MVPSTFALSVPRAAQLFSFVLSLLIGPVLSVFPADAATCTPTGFIRDGINMTAALINPSVVTGTVDATGCNVAVYYDHSGNGGTVRSADIFGANYFGVVVNGNAGAINVDIVASRIHDIGESPHNGAQHGVAVYYFGFLDVSAVTGKLTGNRIEGYQKGGIVANGMGVQVNISDNTVIGDGNVNFIAQNGIQIGYGASASVMRNAVSGNAYTGAGGWASGGILVVGGPGYGTCPDSNPCPYTVNTKINDNTLSNNDVGIYLSNWDVSGPPQSATNIKAVNNTITLDACWNAFYSAGVSDVGNNDKIINNKISGYDQCGISVDADPSFTNRPKVHATK